MSAGRSGRAWLLVLAALACRKPDGLSEEALRSTQERIIARVEGEKVAAGLFEAYLRDNLEVSEPAKREPGAKVPANGTDGGQISDEVKSRLLDRFLLEQALLVAAREAGVEADAEGLDKFSQSVGLGPLAQIHEGATFTEREYLRRYLESCYVVKRFLDGRLAGEKASEEEARAYYQTHASRFSRPDKYRLRLISVETLQEAQKLLKDIGKDGTNFLDVARSLSETGEGDQGKDLGLWPADELPEPFAAALAPLSRGQVSGVVQDPEGRFNILFLEEKIEGGTLPFEEVKDRLIATVTRDRRSAALSGFLDEVRSRARIEVLEANLDFRYVSRAALAGASPGAPGSEPGPTPGPTPGSPAPGGA